MEIIHKKSANGGLSLRLFLCRTPPPSISTDMGEAKEKMPRLLSTESLINNTRYRCRLEKAGPLFQSKKSLRLGVQLNAKFKSEGTEGDVLPKKNFAEFTENNPFLVKSDSERG